MLLLLLIILRDPFSRDPYIILSRVPYKWSRVPYITCPGFPIYYPGYRICGPGSHILTKSYDPFAVIMKYCRMISFQLKWDTVICNQCHALTHAEFIIPESFSVKIWHCHMIPFSLKMRHHIFFLQSRGEPFYSPLDVVFIRHNKCNLPNNDEQCPGGVMSFSDLTELYSWLFWINSVLHHIYN